MLNVRFANVLQYACIYLMATSTPPRSQSQSQPQPSPQLNLLYTMTIMNYYQHVTLQKTSESRYTLYVGMAWTQYMPIQTETFKTQSIKSKLILSLYGHLTFIFRHCIINKAPKVAKSIAKVLNLKVAKLPSCSFFVFLSSDGLCISKLAEGS